MTYYKFNGAVTLKAEVSNPNFTYSFQIYSIRQGVYPPYLHYGLTWIIFRALAISGLPKRKKVSLVLDA